MANLFDYLHWRGDLRFSQDPVNDVDALIFSALSYIHYDLYAQNVTLLDAAGMFFSRVPPVGSYRVKNDLLILEAAAKTVRFGQCGLCLYRDTLSPERETQFAAMTFLLDDGSAFSAFRGTDSTLVGWKEDFNMSFQETVPSQHLAAAYIREVARQVPGPLRLGGHSKGGNLAVFAAARCGPEVQERIVGVYNNDGPGFSGYLMGDPGYLAMVPRIRTLVPQSSVIGMLLQHEEPYTVIRSKSVGLMQHDLYSWEVDGPGLVPVGDTTEGAQFLDATIKAWCAEMTDQQRGQLVDELFSLLSNAGADRTADILHPKRLAAYIKTLSGDEQLRRILSTEFQGLLEAARRTYAQLEGRTDRPHEQDSAITETTKEARL